MKRYFVFAIAFVLSTLPVQVCHTEPSLYDVSRTILYGAGEDVGAILNLSSFSQFQCLLQRLDTDQRGFLTGKDSVMALSEVLQKLISPIKTYEIKMEGFYYPPTKCTYYHYEKLDLHPNAQIASKLVSIASQINTHIKPLCTQKTNFNFAQQYRDALAPAGDVKQCHDIAGLIDYLTQLRKFFPKEMIADLGRMLQALDSNPDEFLNKYANIKQVDQMLFKLISSIDVCQIDSQNVQTWFFPNSILAKKLLTLADQIDLLVKGRQVGISVFDTYTGSEPRSLIVDLVD